MKNLLFLIIVMAATLRGFSQSIYFGEDTVSGTGPASDLIVTESNLANYSAQEVNFTWQRFENIPVGWTSVICDKNNCFAPSTSTQSFTLASGESGLLRVDFTPNDIEGIGIVKLRVFSTTPGVAFDDTITATGITDGMVGIETTLIQNELIYPTITNYEISISSSASICQIYNTDGKLVASLPLNRFQITNISVANWTAGLYLIRLMTSDKKLIATKRFVKI